LYEDLPKENEPPLYELFRFNVLSLASKALYSVELSTFTD